MMLKDNFIQIGFIFLAGIVISIIVMLISTAYDKPATNENMKLLDVTQLYKVDSIYFEYIDVCYNITKIERKITNSAAISMLHMDKKEYDSLIKLRNNIYFVYKNEYNKLNPKFKDHFYLPKPY